MYESKTGLYTYAILYPRSIQIKPVHLATIEQGVMVAIYIMVRIQNKQNLTPTYEEEHNVTSVRSHRYARIVCYS